MRDRELFDEGLLEKVAAKCCTQDHSHNHGSPRAVGRRVRLSLGRFDALAGDQPSILQLATRTTISPSDIAGAGSALNDTALVTSTLAPPSRRQSARIWV